MSTYLDTRDLDARLDELKALRDAVADAQLELQEAESDPEHHTEGSDAAERFNQAENALDSARDAFGTDEQKELAELEELESEVSEWSDGNTLIPESEFTDYCRELLDDIGTLPKDLPSYVVIDWDATADNIKAEYSTVEFQGETYLYRR